MKKFRNFVGNFVGISEVEMESAQAFFVLFFLLPMAVNGWIGIYRVSEMSLRMGFFIFAMGVFSIFVYFSSIDTLLQNKNLIRASGCGFALLYFSIIIMSYAFMHYVLGSAPAWFDSKSGNNDLSIYYLKYSLYYFFPASIMIYVGRILEKDETVLPVESKDVSLSTHA